MPKSTDPDHYTTPVKSGTMAQPASIRPRDFHSGPARGTSYGGITVDPATGELSFWSHTSRTSVELDAVRLLWVTHPTLRSKLDAWVVDGAYSPLRCNACGQRRRMRQIDCRCRLLSLEYARRWLEEKLTTNRMLYEMLVNTCLEGVAEPLSKAQPTTTPDKGSASETVRRSKHWLEHRRLLGPPACALVESAWANWKDTRHNFERLEYKFGLAPHESREWGLIQLLDPKLEQVRSLYVGPNLPEAEWTSIGAEVLDRGGFARLFDRLEPEWWRALKQLAPEERGFCEAKQERAPLVVLRGIFYQSNLYSRRRAASRGRSTRPSTTTNMPKPGDLCSCGQGHLRWEGLHRDPGGWQGEVERPSEQFED